MITLPPIPRSRPVRERIDWGCLNRIAEYTAMRRREMGEERWAELNREWLA
jgi:hypothetical protein